MDEVKPGTPLLPLGPRQRTTVAAALTILAAAVVVGSVMGLAWLVAAFLRRFSHVFLPLAVAAVAALVFGPYFAWLRRRLRLAAPLAVVVVFASILLPLAGFVWFFGALVVGQIAEAVTQIPEWWRQVTVEVEKRWPAVLEFLQDNPWGQRLSAIAKGQQDELLVGLQAIGGKALSAGVGLARGLGALLAWAVFPVYFAFFLLAARTPPLDLEHALPFLRPETRRDVVYLVGEFVNIVVAFFRGQLIIAFLQGVLFAVGFSLVGLRYGFVLGLMLGLLNVIPYLGSMIGLGIGLPVAYFQPGGGTALVVWVLIVFAAVQLVEAYVLTPRIMGQRTGLHPIVIIVAVFFWGSALQGILGMVLAVPLTAFLVVLWRLAREKYIRELV
jgi:predicted PurR-regulated permease PerM